VLKKIGARGAAGARHPARAAPVSIIEFYPAAMDPPNDTTRFILAGVSHPGNVGAAARAMKVMGFSDLVLVAPRAARAAQHEQALGMASGATDILHAARVVGTLAEAVDGIGLLCATAMTPRDFGPPTRAPRELFARLAGEGQRVAFVFGSERLGLANDDVYRCHYCVSIPTASAYGSLNLAQAVQVIAYEWRQALGGFDVQARTPERRLAGADEVQAALGHWQRVLEAIEFLDPAAPKKLMPRLNQLLNRAQLGSEDINILRGIARSVERGRE